MLTFKFNGLNSNFENPIFSTLILSIIIIIIVIFSVNNITFSSIKYIFLGSVISVYMVLWSNYNLLTKKYCEQLLNKHTEEVMSKVIEAPLVPS